MNLGLAEVYSTLKIYRAILSGVLCRTSSRGVVMKLLILSLSFPIVILAGCSQDSQMLTDIDKTQVPQYSIEDFMNSTRYSGASFSPDNDKLLVSDNSTGIFNVYAIAVDGSDKEQLTFSESDAMLAISYFPEDERFLYTADQGGNELYHLYVLEMDGSEIDLTPGENLIASFSGWSGDYESFFVQTNERDPRFFDVYEYQLTEGYPRKMIFRNEEGFSPAQVSPDGRYLALS